MCRLPDCPTPTGTMRFSPKNNTAAFGVVSLGPLLPPLMPEGDPLLFLIYVETIFLPLSHNETPTCFVQAGVFVLGARTKQR